MMLKMQMHHERSQDVDDFTMVDQLPENEQSPKSENDWSETQRNSLASAEASVDNHCEVSVEGEITVLGSQSSTAIDQEQEERDLRIQNIARTRRGMLIRMQRRKHIWNVVSTTVKTVLYLGTMTLFFCLREDWTVTESLYFTMATMSTVGYGDYSPSDNFWNRFFCVLGIFVGIIFVFSQVATLFSQCSDPVFQKGRDILEYLWPQTAIDIDGDGTTDYKVPRHFVIFYLKNLVPVNISFLLLQVVSALIFQHLEGWDFGTAIYHCFVTASTVGYGDVPITSERGMQ